MSDAWCAGDPLYTWGNYRIVSRGPMLAGVSGGWNPAHPNWEHGTHGGPKGKTFWDTTVELVPEAIVVDAELRTSRPGVFAAGDVAAGAYARIAVASGSGVLAARSVQRSLRARR